MNEDGSNGDKQGGSQGDVHRIQLDFSAEAYQKLQQIKAEAGTPSNADTIKNGLRLYEWFLE